MRRDATDAEAVMWRILRDRRFQAVKFCRQVPFQNFILDFVCFERRLVVEIDGSQHADSKSDERRDAILAREGFRVARYWNNDVLQRRSAVMEDLLAKLAPNDPSPGALRAPPSPNKRAFTPVFDGLWGEGDRVRGTRRELP
jgi:very-short-patch-repair endonuclease